MTRLNRTQNCISFDVFICKNENPISLENWSHYMPETTLINVSTLINRTVAFKLTTPFTELNREVNKISLADLATLLDLNQAELKHLNDHIGADATYKLKEQLHQALSVLAHAFSRETLTQDQKIIIQHKIKEGIGRCVEGLFDRVNGCLTSLIKPTTIDQFLAVIRLNILDQAKMQFLSKRRSSIKPGPDAQEVHVAQRFLTLANQYGLGIPAPETGEQIFKGDASDTDILIAISAAFNQQYRPADMVEQLFDLFHSVFTEQGYRGLNNDTMGYGPEVYVPITEFFYKALGMAATDESYIELFKWELDDGEPTITGQINDAVLIHRITEHLFKSGVFIETQLSRTITLCKDEAGKSLLGLSFNPNQPKSLLFKLGEADNQRLFLFENAEHLASDLNEIKSLDQIIAENEDLSSDQKEHIFHNLYLQGIRIDLKHLQGKFKQFFDRSENIIRFLAHEKQEKCDRLIAALTPESLKTFITSSGNLREFLTIPQEKTRRIIRKLGMDNLIDLITSADSLIAVFNCTPVESLDELLDRLTSENLKKFITPLHDDLGKVFSMRREKARKIIQKLPIEHIVHLIGTSHHAAGVLFYLSIETHSTLLAHMKIKLDTIINSVDDLLSILKYLNLNDHVSLLDRISDKLMTLIPTATDVFNAVKKLSDKRSGLLINKMFSLNAAALLHSVSQDTSHNISDTLGKVVELFSHSNPAVRINATIAIWILILKIDNRRLITQANAIPQLLGLLSDSNTQVQENAINIINGLSGDYASHALILEAEAIPKLLRLFFPDKPLILQIHASNVIENLANNAAYKMLRVIVLAVHDLSDPDPKMKENACVVLSALSTDHEVNQRLIAQAGVIPILLELLSDKTQVIQRIAAIKTLANLASHSENERRILQKNAIEPFVLHLSDPDSKIREYATFAISNLGENSDKNQVLIADAGGILPLVNLLSDPNKTIQKNAASALIKLASNFKNQKLFSDSGAIAKLTVLLSNRYSSVRKNAKETLISLGVKPENPVPIATVNGPLVNKSKSKREDPNDGNPLEKKR
jgi:HEAT repeat protein